MLIIEDGTGLAGAQAYVSAADVLMYAVARGKSFTDDTQGESAIVRATTWLDAAYKWPGNRTHGRSQSLQWPRTGAIDADDYVIADNEIPSELVAASCEAAIREYLTPGFLTPDVVPGKVVQSARVDGAVSVTYAVRKGDDVSGQIPVITAIDGILKTLIGGKPAVSLVGKVGRA